MRLRPSLNGAGAVLSSSESETLTSTLTSKLDFISVFFNRYTCHAILPSCARELLLNGPRRGYCCELRWYTHERAGMTTSRVGTA